MGLYALDGEVIDTHVQHAWPLDGGPGPDQTMYWIRPGFWVVEVEDAGEGKDVPDGRPIRGLGRRRAAV